MARTALRRQLTIAARWPLGVCLTSWRYIWRTTAMRRSEVAGNPCEDRPPPLPPGVDACGLQPPKQGVGPLFHRRYQTRIRDAKVPLIELMSQLQRDLDAFGPPKFVSFQKLSDDGAPMQVGDEYVLRMPGPWDGPVRVVNVTPTSFRLATLEGHLEAGEIEFRVTGGERPVFAIESWARSGDQVASLLFEHAPMAKEVELHMWTAVLERVIERSGGRRDGSFDIETRRIDDAWPVERLVPSPRKRRALAALSHAELNFDRSRRHEFTPAKGWNVDDHLQPLPREPPGAPVRGGSWELARRLMRGYEFADPSVVRAFYDPEAPLEGRNMLLELRCLGLRFLAGTRVVSVYEEARTHDGREAHVWGWSYATLEGHLEQGEMSWEVYKWLDTGEVDFRIHAYSRRAAIKNPLTRFGFRLIGRREQLRFVRSTCARMRAFTEQALREGPRADIVRGVAEEVTARPAPAASRSHEQLLRNVEVDSGPD